VESLPRKATRIPLPLGVLLLPPSLPRRAARRGGGCAWAAVCVSWGASRPRGKTNCFAWICGGLLVLRGCWVSPGFCGGVSRRGVQLPARSVQGRWAWVAAEGLARVWRLLAFLLEM